MDVKVVVSAHKLTKIFRDFWWRPKVRAVNEIDFEIRAGEIFGLLGPNGSGKSTTIKTILGLLNPTAGDVEVLGSPPRDVKAKSRIGYLPEESYLYPYLTTEETLDFYGRLFNLPSSERKIRTDQLLKMVGLEHVRKRVVGEFSKGMARRVGLAQALINDPDLIILDEPTSGLDPLGCRQVKDLILKLSARGKSVMLSSHLLADVEDVCDRVAILYGGKIRATGTLDELLEERENYQLTLPEMSPQTLENLIEILRKELKQDPDLRHPRINLERYFLEVVERAQRSHTEHTGSLAGAELADYLRKRPEESKENAEL